MSPITDEERAVLEAITGQTGRVVTDWRTIRPDGPPEHLPSPKGAYKPLRSASVTEGLIEFATMPRATAEALFGADLIAHMIARPCELLEVWPVDPPLVTLTPYAATLVPAKLVTTMVAAVEEVPDTVQVKKKTGEKKKRLVPVIVDGLPALLEEDMPQIREVMVDVTFWDEGGLEVRERMPKRAREYPCPTFDLTPAPWREFHPTDGPEPKTRRELRKRKQRAG